MLDALTGMCFYLIKLHLGNMPHRHQFLTPHEPINPIDGTRVNFTSVFDDYVGSSSNTSLGRLRLVTSSCQLQILLLVHRFFFDFQLAKIP